MKDLITDEQKTIIHIRQDIQELDKKFQELIVTRENNIMKLEDKILDTVIEKTSQDKTNKIKALLKMTTKTNELNILIENRKLLQLIKSNIESIGKHYLGHIPE